jgi:hypothetical protein
VTPPSGSAPVISSVLPTNPVIECSQSINLTCTAGGTAPLTFYWFVNGVPAGVNSSNLTFSASVITNALPVSVLVSNSIGTAFSNLTAKVQDTIAPVITIIGPNPMTVSLHSPFVDPGATAFDSCSGVITVLSSNAVNTDIPGTYFVQFTATDASTNISTNSRTVTVTASSVFIPPNHGLTVSQLNFADGTNSMIGRFEINYDDFNVWYGFTNGFVNIADASNRWVGMNIPIFDHLISDITNITTWFPILNATNGFQMPNMNLYVEFDAAPATNFPPANNVKTNFPVQSGTINIGGVGTNRVTGYPGLTTVSNLVNAAGVSNVLIQLGHPNIEAADNQCAPMSVANSLEYLRINHGLSIPPSLAHVPGITTNIPGVVTNITPSLTNSLVAELEKAMRRIVFNRTNGYGEWPLDGKMKFLAQLGLTNNVHIEHAGMGTNTIGTNTFINGANTAGTPLDGSQNYNASGTTSYGTSPTVSWDWIRDQLRKGKDVELCFAWTNAAGQLCMHYVEVIGVATINGVNVILHVSDQDQSNDTNGTGTVQIDIMSSNTLSSAGMNAIGSAVAVQAISEQVVPTGMAINSLIRTATNIALNVTNGVPNGQYVLRTATNVALPMTNWAPVVTNYFGTNGQSQIYEPWNQTNYGPVRFFRIEVPF